MDFSVIFVTTTSNKSLKNRFWKEKPVENVFTLERLPFNSSMICFILDSSKMGYTLQTMPYVDFTLYFNRGSHLGQQHRPH
jgi:hypothetical protein